MSNPLVVYENLWRGGEIIACSSENPEFPAENTQNDSPQLYWNSVDASGTITIDIDLGAAREYDFVSLRGHNLGPSATIQIIGADDVAFSVNVVTDTLAHYGNNLAEKLAAARTKQYVRISLADAANPSGYLQLGTPVIGKSEVLNREPSTPEQDGFANATETEDSLAGVMFVVQESPNKKVKGLPLRTLDDASAEIIKALIEECSLHQAWLLCLDQADPNSYSLWVRLKSARGPFKNHTNNWDFDMEVEEAL